MRIYSRVLQRQFNGSCGAIALGVCIRAKKLSIHQIENYSAIRRYENKL